MANPLQNLFQSSLSGQAGKAAPSMTQALQFGRPATPSMTQVLQTGRKAPVSVTEALQLRPKIQPQVSARVSEDMRKAREQKVLPSLSEMTQIQRAPFVQPKGKFSDSIAAKVVGPESLKERFNTIASGEGTFQKLATQAGAGMLRAGAYSAGLLNLTNSAVASQVARFLPADKQKTRQDELYNNWLKDQERLDAIIGRLAKPSTMDKSFKEVMKTGTAFEKAERIAALGGEFGASLYGGSKVGQATRKVSSIVAKKASKKAIDTVTKLGTELAEQPGLRGATARSVGTGIKYAPESLTIGAQFRQGESLKARSDLKSLKEDTQRNKILQSLTGSTGQEGSAFEVPSALQLRQAEEFGLKSLADRPAISAKGAAEDFAFDLLFGGLGEGAKALKRSSAVGGGYQAIKGKVSDMTERALKRGEELQPVGFTTKPTSPELQPLMQEARKYKTAEEFVGGQPKVFHGTNADFKNFESKFLGEANGTAPINMTGFSFSSEEGVARTFGKNLIEAKVDIKKPFIIDAAGRDYGDKMKGILSETIPTIDKKIYDGIIIKNYADAGAGKPMVSDHYIPFSPDQIKTKSQLTDIYNQAVGSPQAHAKPIAPELQSLAKEARRYNTVDDFVESQGKTYYHGTNTKFDKFDPIKFGRGEGSNKYGEGVYVSSKKGRAGEYGKNLIEVKLPDDIKIVAWDKIKYEPGYNNYFDKNIDRVKGLVKEINKADPEAFEGVGSVMKDEYAKAFFDGISDSGEIVIFNSTKVRSVPRLQKFYDQATGKTKGLPQIGFSTEAVGEGGRRLTPGEQAQALTKRLPKKSPLTNVDIPQLGAKRIAQLAKTGVETLEDLATMKPGQLLRKLGGAVKGRTILTSKQIIEDANKAILSKEAGQDISSAGAKYIENQALEPGRAANILTNKLDISDEAKQVLMDTAEENANFIKQRRGRVSFKDTEELAKEMIPKTKLKPGQTLNAEEQFSLASALGAQSEKVAKLGEIAKKDNSSVNLLKWQQARHEQMAMQASLSGAITESARATASVRAIKSAIDSRDDILMKKAMQISGGRESLESIIEKLSLIPEGDYAAQMKFLDSLDKPKFWDYFTAFWYNSVLSGPSTHLVNSVSNASNAAFELLNKAPTVAADMFLSAVKGTEREVFLMGELKGAAEGLYGTGRGVKKAFDIMATGYHADDIAKLDMHRPEVFKKLNFAGLPGVGKYLKGTPADMNIPIAFMNTPTRALRAGDIIVRSMYMDAELYSKSFAQATNEVRKAVKAGTIKNGKAAKEALDKRISELIQNPTTETMAAVERVAKRNVFQSDPDNLIKHVSSARNSVPGRLLLPFIETPTNVFKLGLEATPLGLTRLQRATQREQAQAIGRVVTGSAIGAWLVSKALDGSIEISGTAPENKKERAFKYETGWKPNSIKLKINGKDRWIPFANLSPALQGMSSVGSMLEKYDETGEFDSDVAAAGILALAKSTYDQPLLQSMSTLGDAMQGDEYSIRRFLYSQVLAVTSPRFLQDIFKDTTLRDPQTVFDNVRNAYGITQGIPKKLGIFGDDIEIGKLERVIGRDEKMTPVLQAMKDTGFRVSPPTDEINGVVLPPMVYQRYQQQIGAARKRNLDALVNSPLFPSLDLGAKLKLMETLVDVDKAMGDIKGQLMSSNSFRKAAEEQAGMHYEKWATVPTEEDASKYLANLNESKLMKGLIQAEIDKHGGTRNWKAAKQDVDDETLMEVIKAGLGVNKK